MRARSASYITLARPRLAVREFTNSYPWACGPSPRMKMGREPGPGSYFRESIKTDEEPGGSGQVCSWLPSRRLRRCRAAIQPHFTGRTEYSSPTGNSPPTLLTRTSTRLVSPLGNGPVYTLARGPWFGWPAAGSAGVVMCRTFPGTRPRCGRRTRRTWWVGRRTVRACGDARSIRLLRAVR
jgi:hypothetical protein